MSIFVEHEGKMYRIRPSEKLSLKYAVVVRNGWAWRLVPTEKAIQVLNVAGVQHDGIRVKKTERSS